MAEALFKAVFVALFIVGVTSLIEGEFQGWGMALGWFLGTLTGELIYRAIRKTSSVK
jgi:hypothetical protein